MIVWLVATTMAVVSMLGEVIVPRRAIRDLWSRCHCVAPWGTMLSPARGLLNRGTMESFHIPRLRTMARTAAPNVIEGTVIPLGLFYLVMWLVGIWWAIAISLAWSWGTVALRLATGRRVPGLLLLGALGLTARSLTSYLADSVFMYFLQPTLGTVVLAAAFLLSVPAGRPLAARLATDFLPMPDWFASHPVIRRYFLRITLLWGATQLANAGVGLWLLLSQPVAVYLAAKTAATGVIVGLTILGSTMWFRRVVAGSGLTGPSAERDAAPA